MQVTNLIERLSDDALLLRSVSQTVQVVIFASEGMVRSVALRRLPPDNPRCVLVDYDNRHSDEGSVPIEKFERALLGMTREEFDRAATYIL